MLDRLIELEAWMLLLAMLPVLAALLWDMVLGPVALMVTLAFLSVFGNPPPWPFHAAAPVGRVICRIGYALRRARGRA